MKTLKLFSTSLAAVCALLLTGPMQAQAQSADGYPNKPIRVVVPFAAGGPTDVIARVIATHLKNSLGQPILIENRTGAGGNIAIKSVATSPADGYTLLFSSSNIVSNPAMQAPFDPIKDFAPITYAAVSPNIIYVHPSSPIQNVADLAAHLKQKRNPTTYGTPGVGTTPHIACEGLKMAANGEAIHVPYQGAAPVVNAVLGNQLTFGCSALPPTTSHVKAGTLRAIAVTSARRSAVMPNVPTLAESGFPEVVADNLQGLLAPAGTPPAIIDKLHKAVAAILSQPEVRDQLQNIGFDLYATTPAEFSRIIAVELERYTQIIRRAGIKAE
jgi:tripartite-type tricarboxylate transporter receptor subunit TctC